MMMKLWIYTVCLLVLPSTAFVAPGIQQRNKNFFSSELQARSEKVEDSFLLQDFKVASGEVINPYEVLKCSRKATRVQIRSSYIELSRRYHPDAMRNRTILPGSCNNMDEVRDQWERIKLAYEILADAKCRKKYDRHEALADPGKAVQRAAVNAAFQGVSGLGRGLFDMGAFAVNQMTTKNNKTMQEVRAE